MPISTRARRLYFLRHGQTEWNARRLFQGQSDIPLNDNGRLQAKAYAALVQGFFAAQGTLPSFPAAVSSPLSRASETARIVLHELSAIPGAMVPAQEELRLDARLMEQQYGQWEGLPLDEIRQRFPGSVEQQFANMRGFTADGGESLVHLQHRVLDCVDHLPEETLIVGHFGTLYSILLSIWQDAFTAFPKISQDAFFVLEHDRVLRVDALSPKGREFHPL